MVVAYCRLDANCFELPAGTFAARVNVTPGSFTSVTLGDAASLATATARAG